MSTTTKGRLTSWRVTLNGQELQGEFRLPLTLLNSIPDLLQKFVQAQFQTGKRLYLEVRPKTLVDLLHLNGDRITFYGLAGVKMTMETVPKFALYTRDDGNNLPDGFSELRPFDATFLPSNLFLENVRRLSAPEQQKMNLENRYTLVVGPNNCGKSTFLFALRLWVKAVNSSVQQLQWNESTWGPTELANISNAATPENVLGPAESKDASLSITFATHSGNRTTTSLDFVLSLTKGKLQVKPGYFYKGQFILPSTLPPATHFASVYIHSEIRFETNQPAADSIMKLDTWLEDERSGALIRLAGMLYLLHDDDRENIVIPVMRKAFNYFERFQEVNSSLFVVTKSGQNPLILEGSGFKKILYIILSILLRDTHATQVSPFRQIYYFLLFDEISALLFPGLSSLLPSWIDLLFELIDTHRTGFSRSYTVLMTTDSPTFFASLRAQSNILVFNPVSNGFKIKALEPSSAVRLIKDSLGLSGFDQAFLSGIKLVLLVEGTKDIRPLQLASRRINASCQACEMMIIPVGGHIDVANVQHIVSQLASYSASAHPPATITDYISTLSISEATKATSSRTPKTLPGSIEKVISIIDRDYHHDLYIKRKQREHAALGSKFELFAWSVAEMENLVLELLLPQGQPDPISWLKDQLDSRSKTNPAEAILRTWLERFDHTRVASLDTEPAKTPTAKKHSTYPLDAVEPSLLGEVTAAYKETTSKGPNGDPEGPLLEGLPARLLELLAYIRDKSETRWAAQHLDDKRKFALPPGTPIPPPPTKLWRFMDVKAWLNIKLEHPSLDLPQGSVFQQDIARLEEAIWGSSTV